MRPMGWHAGGGLSLLFSRMTKESGCGDQLLLREQLRRNMVPVPSCLYLYRIGVTLRAPDPPASLDLGEEKQSLGHS